jgi:hypothetical protein
MSDYSCLFFGHYEIAHRIARVRHLSSPVSHDIHTEAASVVSGQSSWLQIQRSRVRFPALPAFLRSSGSGTGSTQPSEDN